MTTPMHGLVQYGMLYALGVRDNYILWSASMLGMYSDIGRLIFDGGDWNLSYEYLHRPKTIFSWILLIVVFPLGIHALIDWVYHDKVTGKWSQKAYELESLCWFLFGILATIYTSAQYPHWSGIICIILCIIVPVYIMFCSPFLKDKCI